MAKWKTFCDNYAVPFLYGLSWDAIVTADVIVTATYRIAWAMLTSATITYISFCAYDKVFRGKEINRRALGSIMAGSAVGAGLMTYLMR